MYLLIKKIPHVHRHTQLKTGSNIITREIHTERFTEAVAELAVQSQHLVSDVPAEQDPDGSTTLWTLHFQLVLRVVGQAVGILHRALLCIPRTGSDTDMLLDQ